MSEGMRARRRVLVAYSGGVDSALVARIARDALGGNALAVITDTETLTRREMDAARRTAVEIGIDFLVLPASELQRAEYRANPANRCYFCRQELAGILAPLARTRGFAAIADGIHMSDLGDDRPGIRAMDEAGFWHPLLEAGLDKDGVRALARELSLSCWDKPSNACLSSRIPHGTPITVEALARVEAAEDVLLDLGFRRVRVRHLGDTARIEVGPEEVPRLLAPETAAAVRSRVLALGYREAFLDPRGYRTAVAQTPAR